MMELPLRKTEILWKEEILEEILGTLLDKLLLTFILDIKIEMCSRPSREERVSNKNL